MRFSPAVFATVGLVTLAVLTGCGRLGQSELEFDKTENVKISMIEIMPGSGDVVIQTAPVSDVRIKRVVRYRGSEPGETYRIDDTTLIIDTDCGRRCSVSYDITAPQGVSVRGKNRAGDVNLTDVAQVDVTVGAGSIQVNGASGAVRASTRSGDINVTGTKGTVTLRSGSGTIEGRDLEGGDVTVETDAGDIDLSLAVPLSVRAHTDSGDITVSVPPTGGYRVSARTGSGDKVIAVADDPTATNILDLSTDSGDITANQRL